MSPQAGGPNKARDEGRCGFLPGESRQKLWWVDDLGVFHGGTWFYLVDGSEISCWSPIFHDWEPQVMFALSDFELL